MKQASNEKVPARPASRSGTSDSEKVSCDGFPRFTSSIPRATGEVNAQPDPPYDEFVVRCLRIAYRRGRAILEAQARETAGEGETE
jgi:hypothetical protein